MGSETCLCCALVCGRDVMSSAEVAQFIVAQGVTDRASLERASK
jgi:hypothetical protein